MKVTDKEAITQTLNQNKENRGMKKNPINFNDIYMNVDIDDFDVNGSSEASLEALKSNYSLNVYEPITGNPLKVFLKKVIRKANSFLLVPLATKQSDFNHDILNYLSKNEKATNTTNDKSKYESQEKKIAELEKRINELEKALQEKKA